MEHPWYYFVHHKEDKNYRIRDNNRILNDTILESDRCCIWSFFVRIVTQYSIDIFAVVSVFFKTKTTVYKISMEY